MKVAFIRECDVFGGAANPRGYVLVQVDERTYRIADGKDLAAIEAAHPGLIASFPHELPDDDD